MNSRTSQDSEFMKSVAELSFSINGGQLFLQQHIEYPIPIECKNC